MLRLTLYEIVKEQKILVQNYGPERPPSKHRRASAGVLVADGLVPQKSHFNKAGPEETRTPDLLLAKQALYQLSYRPGTR